MARGLAEFVAAHNLSELIVDTKETTLTLRRGGSVTMAMPAAMPMQMSMPMPRAGSGRARARCGCTGCRPPSTTSRTW